MFTVGLEDIPVLDSTCGITVIPGAHDQAMLLGPITVQCYGVGTASIRLFGLYVVTCIVGIPIVLICGK